MNDPKAERPTDAVVEEARRVFIDRIFHREQMRQKHSRQVRGGGQGSRTRTYLYAQKILRAVETGEENWSYTSLRNSGIREIEEGQERSAAKSWRALCEYRFLLTSATVLD